MQASGLDKKERQRIAKESSELMMEWRGKVLHSRDTAGKPEGYNRSLWICVNRYVRKDVERTPRKRKGLTLFLAHAIGNNKETWEPFIRSLLKSRSGRDIEEVWAWDAVDNGDSALLNAGKLNFPSDWYDVARDLTHFLLHYIPPKVTSEELPVCLPCVSTAELQTRIHQGYTDRQVVVVGHSYVGNVCARACYTYPQLFTALVLIDPGILAKDEQNDKQLGLTIGQAAFARRDGWNSKFVFLRFAPVTTLPNSNSRKDALSSFRKSPFFASWHPDALQLLIDHGLYCTPNQKPQIPNSEGVDTTWHLKMHPIYEALANVNAGGLTSDMYDKVPEISGRVYIKWVMPDVKNGGGMVDPKRSAILVNRRPGYTSHVNIPDTGHMIPLQKPEEVGELDLFFSPSSEVKNRTLTIVIL
ncbi:hypothetical protein GYMLUDRAFT_251790 [Collybiopsis luxurians FD-317 M1]|uniref:Unplaced genomic scaffold GYMLUscaffold_108, whole genome shotgun sequence n=1 Tax=Collybiopsis luxurians FD-317 M1 TaxID=944289 RepID=A0A0D0BBH9_9AGAR|nr:hypothetical protein GYMLUDRAFT_251790 [Collybiopsis luxurians FD-317 M1]